MPDREGSGNTGLREMLFGRLADAGIDAAGSGASAATRAIAVREILGIALATPAEPDTGETLADRVFDATIGAHGRDGSAYRPGLEALHAAALNNTPLGVHPAVLSVRALRASAADFPEIQAAGLQALAALHAAGKEGVI